MVTRPLVLILFVVLAAAGELGARQLPSSSGGPEVTIALSNGELKRHCVAYEDRGFPTSYMMMVQRLKVSHVKEIFVRLLADRAVWKRIGPEQIRSIRPKEIVLQSGERIEGSVERMPPWIRNGSDDDYFLSTDPMGPPPDTAIVSATPSSVQFGGFSGATAESAVDGTGFVVGGTKVPSLRFFSITQKAYGGSSSYELVDGPAVRGNGFTDSRIRLASVRSIKFRKRGFGGPRVFHEGDVVFQDGRIAKGRIEDLAFRCEIGPETFWFLEVQEPAYDARWNAGADGVVKKPKKGEYVYIDEIRIQ